MEKRSCEEAALRKLQYGAKTEAELQGFLREQGYEREEVGEVIEYLRSMNYLNDKRYVREFYNVCRGKCWSEHRIIHELERRGIEHEISEPEIDDFKASDEFEGLPDDESYALRVGYKMARNHLEDGKSMDDKFYNKVGRRLVGLGYRERTVYYVLDKLRRGGKAISEASRAAAEAEITAEVEEAHKKELEQKNYLLRKELGLYTSND